MSVWPVSFNTMLSRFVRGVASAPLFHCTAGPRSVYPVHSASDAHFDGCYLFGIVNSLQIFVERMFSILFEYIPRSGIAGSYGDSVFEELRIPLLEELSNCFPPWFPHFIFPPAASEGSVFSTSSPTRQNKKHHFFLSF